MSRIPKLKELTNTRLANAYGGWIYCGGCGKTIGYLCYVTYDDFYFCYKCKCGNSGSVHVCFGEQKEPLTAKESLITIKNRLCCSNDNSPLFTLLYKNLSYYKYEIVCEMCGLKFTD